MPFARRRRHTASPSMPGIATSSTTRSGARALDRGQRGAAVGGALHLEALGRQACGRACAARARRRRPRGRARTSRSAAGDVAAQEDQVGADAARARA